MSGVTTRAFRLRTSGGLAVSGRFPYLQDGDVVTLEILGLGRRRHGIRPA